MFVSPLIESLRRLDAKKDRGVLVLYVIILVIFIFLALLPFSSVVQKIALSKFHLTVKPFSRWAALQTVPAMYNFQNRIFWAFIPLNENFDVALPQPAGHLAVNHYPLRMIFFTAKRQELVFQEPVYFYLSSVYRGRQRITSYMMSSTPRNIRFQLLNSYERFEQ